MGQRQDRDRAVGLFVNYFEAIAKKAGMKWDADYTEEIGEAVDAIIDAAVSGAIDALSDHVKGEALR